MNDMGFNDIENLDGVTDNTSLDKNENFKDEIIKEITSDSTPNNTEITSLNKNDSISQLGKLFKGNRKERRNQAKNLKKQLKRKIGD